MSLLKSPMELNQEPEPGIFLICGEPAVGKTTFATSAPNPFALDCDNSTKRIDAEHQVSTLPVRKYEDVLSLLDSRELDGFQTCIVDAFGMMVGMCHDYVKKKPKMSDPRKSWPETTSEMSSMFRSFKARGMHFVGLIHATDNEVDGKRQVRPVSAGKPLNEISYLADIYGLMYLEDRKRYFEVFPHGMYQFPAKGNKILGDRIEIPELVVGAKHDQFTRLIINPYLAFHRAKAAKSAVQLEAYTKLVESQAQMIASVIDIDQMNVCYAELKGMPEIGDSVSRYRQAIKELLVERGWKLAAGGKFEVV